MGELHFPLCCAASSAMWLWAGKTKHKQDVMITQVSSSNCELGQMICEAGARRVARGVMGNSAIGGMADAAERMASPFSLSLFRPYRVTRSAAQIFRHRFYCTRIKGATEKDQRAGKREKQIVFHR